MDSGLGRVTVMIQTEVKPPSCIVAVMLAEPAAMAVTSPVVAFTVAILTSSLLHVTVWLVALAGSTIAVSVCFSPIVSVKASGSTVTPVTGIIADTVTSAVLLVVIAVFVPLALLLVLVTIT